MALVETILGDLDAAVLDVGETYFTSTADALDPMLTIVTTLLIALVGVNMALGAYRLSMRDAWQGLCCTNRLLIGLPLSPDRFILRPL